MVRPRTVSDEAVFAAVRGLLAAGGPRAVSFAAVARQSGLSGASLVQRYASRDGMVRAALAAGWEALQARTEAAATAAAPGPRGAAQLLKALAAEAGGAGGLAVLAGGLDDRALRRRAADWRATVEAALAGRLGGGRRQAAEAAALLFLAWQGRILWQEAGGPGFRLRAAAERLAAAPAGEGAAAADGEAQERAT